MLPTFRFSLFVTVLMGIAIAGCSSSSSTSQDTPAAAADSSALQTQPLPQHKISHKQNRSASGSQQGFVTQEDTIEAQVVTRKENRSHPKPPSKQSSKKKYYSVQLGAFRSLSNADRVEKSAKQRYKRPVHQFYDKAIKMYRVTVGNFSKLKDAWTFLKDVQKQHPKEYKDAWVAEMRK